ncbi:hypothetical protein EVAR_74077_1, partial [Eumeta japonica]
MAESRYRTQDIIGSNRVL